MSLWKNYFGLGEVASSGTTPTNKNPPMTSLPETWYTSPDLYELERRAVFSKKWLLTTHSLRLANTGDWLQYTIAGFPFVIVKDREGKINAFHNVCRHRAFPVVTEESGKSRIFSCKYHGWSYGLNGKLAKAPGYQELEGFDKSQNGLLPIHVHVDRNGFVWVNLDAGEKPEIAWEDDFKDVDLQSRFQDFNFENYNYDHTWDVDGEFNWKILADYYNERYHSPTANPDVSSLADLSSYSAETKDGSIMNFANATPEQIAQGLKTASTYYFPNASMTVSPHFFFMQRFVPTSSTHCSMRYEAYRHRDSSDSDFNQINQTYKHIMSEDKDHCESTQKNPHNSEQNSPLYFQSSIRDILQEHHQREESAKREIWPARQAVPENASTTKDDEDLASKVIGQRQTDCGPALTGGCCGGGCMQAGNDGLVY